MKESVVLLSQRRKFFCPGNYFWESQYFIKIYYERIRGTFFSPKKKIVNILFTFSKWPSKSIIQNPTMKLSLHNNICLRRSTRIITISITDPTVKLSLHTRYLQKEPKPKLFRRKDIKMPCIQISLILVDFFHHSWSFRSDQYLQQICILDTSSKMMDQT